MASGTLGQEAGNITSLSGLNSKGQEIVHGLQQDTDAYNRSVSEINQGTDVSQNRQVNRITVAKETIGAATACKILDFKKSTFSLDFWKVQKFLILCSSLSL